MRLNSPPPTHPLCFLFLFSSLLSIFLSLSLCLSLSVFLPVRLYMCLAVCLSVSLVCLSVSVFLSVCLLSFCLPNCLSHLNLGNADPAEDTSTEASFLEVNGLLSSGSNDCLTKRIKLFDNGNHSTDFETMSQLDLKLYASLYGLDSSTADQHLPMLLREHMDKRRSSLNGAALTQLAEHASAATTMPPATNKTPGQCTEPYSVIVDGATVHFPPLLDGTLVEFSASDIGDEGQ